jgi:hypothetical protein
LKGPTANNGVWFSDMHRFMAILGLDINIQISTNQKADFFDYYSEILRLRFFNFIKSTSQENQCHSHQKI